MTTAAIPTGRILIRGAHILSQDPSIGELVGDVLVDDGRIVEVGPNLSETITASANVIDGTDRAVLPGFIDTHRHTWQGTVRQTGIGWDFGAYRQHVQLTWGTVYTPEDVYIGNLLGAVNALDAGITTLRDESHIQNSPDHTDQAVAALRDSGLRAVFAYGWPSIDSNKWMLRGEATHPEDIRRVRSDLLPDDNALVTLQAMLRGPELSTMEVTTQDVALARDLGLRSSMHAGNGPWVPELRGIGSLYDAGLLGSDMLFIHCCTSSDDELRQLADAGAGASIAAAIEANMPGLGAPQTGRMLKLGIRPSFSIDTEAIVAGDMFNVMRAAISAHGVGVQLDPGNYADLPAFTPADLLEFATLRGAEASGLANRTGSITPRQAGRPHRHPPRRTHHPARHRRRRQHRRRRPPRIRRDRPGRRQVRTWQGHLVHIDLDKIRADAQAARERLLATPLVEG